MASTHDEINKSHDINQPKTDMTTKGQNKFTTLFSLSNGEKTTEETKQLC